MKVMYATHWVRAAYRAHMRKTAGQTAGFLALAANAAALACLTMGGSIPPAAPNAQFTTPDANWAVSVAFSPNGKVLAVGSVNEVFSNTGVSYHGGHTYLWTVPGSRHPFTTLSDPGGKGVLHAVFSRDGKYLAVADANGSVYVWNAASRKVLTQLTDPGSAGLTGVAFGSGGTIFTADGNGSAYQWSLSSSGAPAATV